MNMDEMKSTELNKNKYLKYSLIATSAIAIGWVLCFYVLYMSARQDIYLPNLYILLEMFIPLNFFGIIAFILNVIAYKKNCPEYTLFSLIFYILAVISNLESLFAFIPSTVLCFFALEDLKKKNKNLSDN